MCVCVCVTHSVRMYMIAQFSTICEIGAEVLSAGVKLRSESSDGPLLVPTFLLSVIH
jgi:hypothetical protein